MVERRGAAIEIVSLRKVYGTARTACWRSTISISRFAGRIPLYRGAERMRQVDPAAHPRRPRYADHGLAADRCRRLGGRECHGVPGQRPVPLDERRGQCRVRPDDARRPAPERAERVAAALKLVGLANSAALPASVVRRHAPARGDRARIRHRPGDAVDGRAVRGARRTEPRRSCRKSSCASGRRRARPWSISRTRSTRRCSSATARDHDRAAWPHQTDHRCEFPHPRNLMALSATPAFGALKLDIWRVLEDEVMRARAEAEQ